ncbi:MAG: helix-turn-helix domain-containing protein [Thermoprotei archaeon]
MKPGLMDEEGSKSGLRELRGNTLRVYVFLLKSGPSELREVQRGLGLSSPSLASYHLSRLVELKYVVQDADGKYSVSKDVSPEILEGYLSVGGRIVPQLFFFSVFFTVLLGYFGYRVFMGAHYVPDLAVTGFAVVGVLWWETIRLIRRTYTMK